MTKLKLEAEFVSHPDFLVRRPIDPAMANSFGSYSEPGTRNNYQAEISPMVRDDDDVTPELRWLRDEGVGSHIIYFDNRKE